MPSARARVLHLPIPVAPSRRAIPGAPAASADGVGDAPDDRDCGGGDACTAAYPEACTRAMTAARAAFANALALSCRAVREPGRPGLANQAIRAHAAARAWAEEAVRRAAPAAAAARPGDGRPGAFDRARG